MTSAQVTWVAYAALLMSFGVLLVMTGHPRIGVVMVGTSIVSHALLGIMILLDRRGPGPDSPSDDS